MKLKFGRNKKVAARDDDAMVVRYEVAGREVFLEAEGASTVSRLARNFLRRQERNLLARFGHLRHPETGERPVLTISVPDPSKREAKARLDTDSPALRDWLRTQGVVIEENTVVPANDEAGPETSGEARQ